MASYATGNALAKVGVLSGFDMTKEAALTKVLFALENISTDQVKQILCTPLRRNDHLVLISTFISAQYRWELLHASPTRLFTRLSSALSSCQQALL